MKLYQCSWIYHSHLRFRLTLRNIHHWFAKLERAATFVARSTTLPGCGWHHNAYPPETTAGGCGLREADSQLTCSFTKEGLEMLMDNTFELLGITDSNIKITRFSAESVNGEKRNVIEARLVYNVDRFPLLRINGRNSYMNPCHRKRRRCWYVTVPIWKNTEETDGDKKIYSISEVKFSRSSTPFDKDLLFPS